MTERSLVEAVNLALARAMTEDESVIVLGEDVGIDGGVFRATNGLIDKFGAARVRDTPLAEAVIAGVSVGLAAAGFKPIAEIQFMGFSLTVLDQLVNHASRLRNRTQGRLTCPMVLRAPYGGGIHALEHHSESFEALFTHIPGLRVVIPSSPSRAYGLLLAAIRDPDPVVFFEPKRLYRLSREDMADDGKALPLDKCVTLRGGQDLTIVTWGAMCHDTLSAAQTLSEEGIEAEVIDVATLRPLDFATIQTSVEKTGRCLIVHEAVLTGGYGGEIAARLSEHALMSLLAPIKRVTAWDTIVPYPRHESHFIPSPERIATEARELMAFA